MIKLHMNKEEGSKWEKREADGKRLKKKVIYVYESDSDTVNSTIINNNIQRQILDLILTTHKEECKGFQ